MSQARNRFGMEYGRRHSCTLSLVDFRISIDRYPWDARSEQKRNDECSNLVPPGSPGAGDITSKPSPDQGSVDRPAGANPDIS